MVYFVGIMNNQQRIQCCTLILIAVLWTADVLFAQPQPLPHVPLPHIPLPQISLDQSQPAAGMLSLTLTRTSPDNLVQILRQICGHRFVVQSQYQYAFSTNRENNPRQALLRIEPQANRVILTGDRQLSEQIHHLVTAIDQPPQQGRGRELIPYQHVHPDVLIRAFDSFRVQRPLARRIPNEPTSVFDTIRQVQFQVQEGGFFDTGIADPSMLMQGGAAQGWQPGDPNAIGVIDDLFRYRIVPDLDVIIIEADGARLAQFTGMIRQLEELSKINRPKIEVISLKHVNNVSLGAIFTQDVYNLFFQTTQGQVRIIAMTSPNAMLLIGWGDSLERAKEIVTALDQPIAVENSRLHIFKLSHISAQQARNVLAGAFPAPPPASPLAPPSGFIARIQLFHEARSNTLIVQAAPNDLAEAKRILDEIDVPASAVRLQVKTFRLNNSLAPNLAETLRNAITGNTQDGKSPALELLIRSPEGQRIIQSGIMSDVAISTDPQNNVVIVRAPEACMEFIEELIKMLDIASPEAAIKIFQIENGDANSLVTMLTSLIPSNVEGTPGPQLPGSTEGEALIPIRFAVDRRTNSIVAAGSVGDLMIVEALLTSLDREDSLTREQTVYFLKNMKAENVAATVNEYIRSRRSIQQESPGVISPFQQIESEVIVVSDVESNSLIISATPRYYDEIIKLIEEIDRTPPQVVINVLIAEVMLSENKEWAAELGLQDPILFGRGGPGMNFNNISDPLGNSAGTHPGSVASQMLTNFPGAIGRAGGGLVFSASSDYLDIMLRALHSNNRLEVLSSPQITTMNNQQAVLSVGQTVPRSRGTQTINNVTSQNIVDVDVNMMLTITPTISPEGTIVMAVVVVKDKVGGYVDVAGQRMQSIDTSNLGTMISAANNQTVVLGGLITKEETRDIKKVPFLGDIPLLGKFFRHEADKTVRKELLVILTPRIVKSQEDMEHVKQLEMARMNWCLKNVVETHGDIGAYSVVSPRPYTGNIPVIMPGPVKMEELQPILAPTLPTPTLPKRN